MKFNRKTALRLEIAALPIVLAGLIAPSAAWAADEAPAAPATEECKDTNLNGVCDSDETGAIVVTGSRIARDPNLASPVPLTAVSSAQLVEQGKVSLGDALNDLPSIRSTYSQGNSTRFIGTAGLNLLDLRGLGISRTLVLVNGRRHITASPGDYLVDTNTIPVDLLDRVDVVTGGNSAIYGSDAVAGVVNFILKRNYEGLTVKGQGGISSQGDRGSYFVAGTYGKNFADGRGNIAISAEYAQARPLYFSDRDSLTGAFSGRCQFQTTDLQGAAGGEIGFSATDGIPDQTFVCGVKNAAISDGGTVGPLDASSSSTRRYLRFSPTGDLFIDTPTLSYAPVGSGNQLGGQGATLRNTGQMFAGLKRYSFNLLAHYDVSDAFRPYIEAKYVRVNAIQEGQPSFLNSGPQSVGGAAIRCNNGFLTAANLAILQANGFCSNVATSTINLARFNTDFGGRGEKHTRETYRIVAGVEGTFNEDWHYDVSVNYGQLKTKMDSVNNLLLFDVNGNPDGFNLASDAVLAPTGFTGSNFVLNAAGQKVICRINSTTNSRTDCVPINLFGVNQASPAALAFVNTTAHRDEKATEFDATASISGDLSQLFSLPGGPVGFALGAEYRAETASSAFDALTASGGTFLNAIQPFNPKKLTVKEAFGEINLPILKDSVLGKELSVHGAGRVSDYNTSTGTVWAWNADAIYAPIDDIKFRASFATSVRAPTQSDLFSPFSQNFAQLTDPCDSSSIGTGIRVQNCAAAGVPTTVTAAVSAACNGTAFNGAVGTPWRNCLALTSSTGFVSGGNPTLKAEKGRSVTLGVLLTPRWIPGFSFSADWYKIKVTDLIATLGAQTIVNLCYDSVSGINNPYCAVVNRNSTTGLFVQPAVISGGINFAAQKTEGIDFDAQYRHNFGNGVKLTLRGIATLVKRLDNFTDPTLPFVPNRQLGELGDPIFAANFYANIDVGNFSMSWTTRYLGPQSIGTWEAQHQYTGLCPTAGAFTGIAGADGRTCTPGTLTLLDPQNADLTKEVMYPSVFYHSMRMNLKMADNKFNFYVGMDNVFDTKPPLGLLGTAGGDPYDTTGRFFYAGFKASF